MHQFSAQYSTLSAIVLNDFIKHAYGFKQLTCRLLAKNVSDTYLLEDEESKYILKIYRHNYRPFDEIKGEAELLNILKDSGVSVSYPLKDLSGNEIQQFDAAEGIRYGILFTYASGEVVTIPDDDQLCIIGRTIAAMHDITSTCQLQYERPVYDVYSTLEKPLELVAGRFAGLPDQYAFLQDISAKVIKKLKQFDTSGFSYGYCHYDLLPKNFHFDDDNRITFFDFDWAGKGFLMNDLMTFRVQLAFLIHYQMMTTEEADRCFAVLIAAYREKRHVSDVELQIIPYLGVMFFMYGFRFYEENFDDFSIAFLTPRFIKDRVELIKKWGDWYCDFDD
ncbi:MAG TPA: phosphotransferase [Mucilaginibacter sp.]|jgi:Ser/Thr protein kinase RdoA (MazF antagonist)|nr:phosphotransferase [Mucilaginibacter sp.]